MVSSEFLCSHCIFAEVVRQNYVTGMPRIMKLTRPSKCGSSSLLTEVEVEVTDNPILESWTFS